MAEEHVGISVRGRDLATEIVGHMTFTELLLLDITGRAPAPGEVRVVDAVLVTLMEHGITPSSLITRLALDGAPESTQGAIAAGLLSVGSRFLGVIEDVARLLQEVVASAGEGGSLAGAARVRVEAELAARRRIPGLGHNFLSEDPRPGTLLGIAREEGLDGPHAEALEQVRLALAEATGRPFLVNATGGVGAVLSDLDFEADMIRGFALVARCGGLVAHLADERRNPIGRRIWAEARSIPTTE
jgi:citrate synthase